MQPQTLKIRQVASTLLDSPFSEQDNISRRANGYIQNFVDILAKLDGNLEAGTQAWNELNEQSRTSPSAFWDLSD